MYWDIDLYNLSSVSIQNKICISITFKRNICFNQTSTTQIENSIYFTGKPVFNQILKDYWRTIAYQIWLSLIA